MSCRVQADFRSMNRPLMLAYQRLRSLRGVANSTVACGPHSAWDSFTTRYYSSRSYALTATTLPPGLVNVNGQVVVSVPSMLCMQARNKINVNEHTQHHSVCQPGTRSTSAAYTSLDGITHRRANYRMQYECYCYC